MIAHMVQWIRGKFQTEPYDPDADPIAKMLADVTTESQLAAHESRESVQQNRLEAAILHDRLKPNGGERARPME
jgi:hypothetical protein